MTENTMAKPGTTVWPPERLKEAREALGLSLAEMAPLLETDARSLRAMESDPSVSQFRLPPPRLVRLLEAYLSGYRPSDWPLRR